MSHAIYFNPLPEHHAIKASIPALVEAYDLGGKYDYSGQSTASRLFDVSTQGNIEGSMAYAIAAHAAQGSPANLVMYCKGALLARLFGDTDYSALSHEQRRLHAYVIGLMDDLGSAFDVLDNDTVTHS